MPRRSKKKWCGSIDWRNPVILVLLVGAVLVVVASWVFWHQVHQKKWLPTATRKEVADVYISMLTAIVTCITTYAIALGLLDGTTQEEVAISNAALTDVEAIMRANYPWSVRLYKQLYSCDPVVRALCEPRTIDRNRRRMFESTMLSIIFQSIEDVLKIEAVPGSGWCHLWASYFRAPITRRAWCERRCYFDVCTQQYIDRRFVDDAYTCDELYRSLRPRLCYWCDANTIKNPAVQVAIGFTLLLVVGAAVYWSLLAKKITHDHAEQWTMFLDIVTAVAFVASLLLLVYGYVATRTVTVVNNVRAFTALETTINDNYPRSIDLYRQMYACDTLVQRIRFKKVRRKKQRMFESTFSTALFQSMQNVLVVQGVPSVGDHQEWASWFESRSIRRLWCAKRIYYDARTRDYVHRNFVCCE